MNGFRTILLLAAMMALCVALGFLAGGPRGAAIALLAAAVVTLFTVRNADRLVLAMHGAREVDALMCPELVGLVHGLAHTAGLPPPRVYVIESAHPNAFATGRDPAHAAVAATTGLLGLLTRDEIAAVMAHELGHIRHRDTLVMTMTATIAGAISLLAGIGLVVRGRQGLLAGLLAPVAAMIVQMAISRNREYAADRAAAEISGKPQALAAALAKLAEAAARVPNPVAARMPAAAALYIVPIGREGRDTMFSTHPTTARRIAALRAMAPRPARRRAPSALAPHGRG